MKSERDAKHIVVVGSGIAGLIAALEIGRKHDVTLVTKAKLAESNTRYAQGGIAAAMSLDDSVAEHIADTLSAGAGLCDATAVEILCTEGPARIRDLIRINVSFDYRDGELARGLEAAHSRPRVLHAGGDATGLTIETALVRAVLQASNVKVFENTFACDVLLERGRASGLEVLHEGGERERLHADAVVLASGGAGQLFEHTTNPAVATGDGVAMAFRAGAHLSDVEFYQFHPTLLVAGGTPFLISEAVRGEGAVLLDANGRRFMQAVHSGAELAPRDVVARGIAAQMAAQDGKPVYLDATALGEEFLRRRFPTIDGICRERGLNWAKQPIPVTPAAHYCMGGVRTDVLGRTSVAGLYAVGEVACTGVHGANRLASNSLLESLVFAWRCAQSLLSDDRRSAPSNWPAKEELSRAEYLVDNVTTATEPSDRAALQRLMWEHVGIRRSKAGLQRAAAQLQRWNGVQDTVFAAETANLLALARVMVTAALAREESRGAHHRDDFPESSEVFATSQTFARLTTQAQRNVEAACA